MLAKDLEKNRYFKMNDNVFQKLGMDGDQVIVRTVCIHARYSYPRTRMLGSSTVTPITAAQAALHEGHSGYQQ